MAVLSLDGGTRDPDRAAAPSQLAQRRPRSPGRDPRRPRRDALHRTAHHLQPRSDHPRPGPDADPLGTARLWHVGAGDRGCGRAHRPPGPQLPRQRCRDRDRLLPGPGRLGPRLRHRVRPGRGQVRLRGPGAGAPGRHHLPAEHRLAGGASEMRAELCRGNALLRRRRSLLRPHPRPVGSRRGSRMINRAPHSLYLHVPFCVSKCPYCDFNSHVGNEGLFESYSRALVTEIESWGRELHGPRLDTVFIGGGTPSRGPAAHIAAALDAVRRSFDLASDAEVTLEANPQSAEAVKMEAWLRAGVNRLSLGFQSLDAAALGFLGRAHDAQEAIGVFGEAREAGFDNVSCDLIFGVPGLSTARWAEVVAEVLALGPDHLSAYELTPESGTRLGAEVNSGRTVMPDEDLVLAQYEVAGRLLQAQGFHRYEVSSWPRPGRECRHNLAYWSGVPYAAAGAGAHAFVFAGAAPGWLGPGGGRAALVARQWNVANPAAYISAVRHAGQAPAGHEWLRGGTASR